jgi:general secretion pathway protein E
VKNIVSTDCDITRLRRQAIGDGMRPLRLNGAQKVANGLTTVEEVLKVVPQETAV